MNCQKYTKKADHQRNTWLTKLPTNIVYYHVVGNPKLSSNYSFDNESHILWIRVKDDYNSLPQKVIRAYEAIHETMKYQYILKTDDDQMLKEDSFFDILSNLIITKQPTHYGGRMVDVKQNYLSQYHKIHPELPKYLPVLKTKYCSGRFYFLSKEAVEDLLKKKILIEREFLEDYAIGYYLHESYKQNMLYLETDHYFQDFTV
jgi:hypothetical protein